VHSLTDKNRILSGNIFKTLLSLGWPVMLSAVFETLYHVTDTFWLGRLEGSASGDAVAGLQVAFPIIWFAFAFIMGFSMSGVALVSQYTGANKKREADYSAAQMLLVALLSSIIISALGYFSVGYFIPLITTDRLISTNTISYLEIFFISMPLIFITGVFRALMSATGNTLTPMYVVAFGNILNIVIDPIFIFGLGPISPMGIKGAAIATMISMLITSGIALFILFKGEKGINLKIKYLVPDIKLFAKIFRIGFPAAAGHSSAAAGFVILMFIMGKLPNAREALGGYGVGGRLISFAFIAMTGLGQGLTTIIGQSLGSGNKKRAEYAASRGIILLFIVLVFEMALLVLFRRELISLFIPYEQQMIAEGATFLLYFGFSVPLFGVITGINSTFNAAGFNIPVMIISFCRLWIFRLPLTWLFAFTLNYGSTGIWVGMSISNLATAIVAIAFFIQGRWKTAVI